MLLLTDRLIKRSGQAITGQRNTHRREQILDAAIKVFSHKGFKAATNKEIAREAGVTPGLLYWYFRNKEDLFQAVVESKTMLLPLNQLSLELMDAPPREYLTRVATMLARIFDRDEVVSAFRFVMAEALRSRYVRNLLTGKLISRGLQTIADYLEHQARLGAIRPVDPMLAARQFLGLLISQVILGRLLELEGPAPLPEAFSQAVETFLAGILPRQDDPR